MTLEEAAKIEIPQTDPLIDWIPFTGAESYRMLYQRLSRFLSAINEKNEDIVIFVSHGGAIRACIYWWLEIPLTKQSDVDFDIDTCSISCLRVNEWEQRTLSVLNSSDHLLSLISDI